MKVIGRYQAKQEGLTRYFLPQHPCPKGHRVPRRVTNGACIECEKERNRAYRKTPQGRAARAKAKRRAYWRNPERERAKSLVRYHEQKLRELELEI